MPCLFVCLSAKNFNIDDNFLIMVSDGTFIFHMCIHCGKTISLIPRSRSSFKGGCLIIRPSKTGRIMGSPVAGGRRPVLCPEHISKTTLPRVMKFHGWIDLIQGECSAQES